MKQIRTLRFTQIACCPAVKKRLQPIPWRALQVAKLGCGLYHSELTASDFDEIGRKSFGTLTVVDRLRNLVPEAADRHWLNVSPSDTFHKEILIHRTVTPSPASSAKRGEIVTARWAVAVPVAR
jgi:hypothetical protein